MNSLWTRHSTRRPERVGDPNLEFQTELAAGEKKIFLSKENFIHSLFKSKKKHDKFQEKSGDILQIFNQWSDEKSSDKAAFGSP